MRRRSVRRTRIRIRINITIRSRTRTRTRTRTRIRIRRTINSPSSMSMLPPSSGEMDTNCATVAARS